MNANSMSGVGQTEEDEPLKFGDTVLVWDVENPKTADKKVKIYLGCRDGNYPHLCADRYSFENSVDVLAAGFAFAEKHRPPRVLSRDEIKEKFGIGPEGFVIQD